MCSDLKSGQKRRQEDVSNILTHNCLYNIDPESSCYAQFKTAIFFRIFTPLSFWTYRTKTSQWKYSELVENYIFIFGYCFFANDHSDPFLNFSKWFHCCILSLILVWGTILLFIKRVILKRLKRCKRCNSKNIWIVFMALSWPTALHPSIF